MRPGDVEDIWRYRYAAQNHSHADLRAAAACRALDGQGKTPTVTAVAKLADVEFALAEETVGLWANPAARGDAPRCRRAVEVASWGDSVGRDRPARRRAASTSAGWRSRRPPT